jgi:hypothetical protein
MQEESEKVEIMMKNEKTCARKRVEAILGKGWTGEEGHEGEERICTGIVTSEESCGESEKAKPKEWNTLQVSDLVQVR